MSIRVFAGGAGCGKTHSLVQSLTEELALTQLREGQRVLALTFMHGSRRRLEARLRAVNGLSSRYECSTIDSVAWRLVTRWRTLTIELFGARPNPKDFDAVCNVAGRMLNVNAVRTWVASSFPIVLVDEAQDLTAERLRIVQELSRASVVFAAADEFQCLNETLRPNPFSAWAGGLETRLLMRIWRTEEAELLNAAAALRAGRAPVSGQRLQVAVTPAPAVAGAWLSNHIGWYCEGGSVAVLAPSMTDFVKDAVDWARTRQTNRGNGPFTISWERSERETAIELCGRLAMPAQATTPIAIAAVEALADRRISPYVRGWIETQRRVAGRQVVERQEVEAAIEDALAHRRRYGRGSEPRRCAMSVHSAKNREFDHVVVLWPYQVGGDDEHKRRLLYNAITRARRRCLVLVQANEIRNAAPFA